MVEGSNDLVEERSILFRIGHPESNGLFLTDSQSNSYTFECDAAECEGDYEQVNCNVPQPECNGKYYGCNLQS